VSTVIVPAEAAVAARATINRSSHRREGRSREGAQGTFRIVDSPATDGEIYA
jgi:hypothetical protein